MPSLSLYIDPTDVSLKSKVAALQPSPGYCIFIDIVGSTAMKQRGIQHWVALVHNCFSDARSYFHTFPPLKGIGDELMYYIEEVDLAKAGVSALQIYDYLFQIAANQNVDFPETKISGAYCDDVYPLTFLSGTQDYYGADIDRAARLKTIDPPLAPRQVVIDQGFYQRIQAARAQVANAMQFPSFALLAGPEVLIAKGVPNPIQFYRANAV